MYTRRVSMAGFWAVAGAFAGAVACAGAVASAGSVRGEAARPTIGTKEGQVYPDFLLPKLEGGFGRLSDHRGKKVLLIHFASW